MKAILGILLFLITIQSFSQQIEERFLYAEKEAKYKRMKNVGAVLSVAGTIAMIVVAAKLNENEYTAFYYASDDDDFAIAVAAVAGVSMLGTGIPLWIVGGINENKYREKFKSISVGARITPHAQGLTLTYRF
jgi:hypothetical protein